MTASPTPQLRIRHRKTDRIRVEVIDQSLTSRLRQIPGFYQRDNQWTWPATPFVAGRMVEQLQGVHVDYDDGWYALYETYQAERQAAMLKTETDLPDHKSNTKSWLHQRQAYQYLSRLTAGGLFADMGTGKTKVVVDLIANMGHETTLVICPKKAMRGWILECAKHSYRPLRVLPLVGAINDRCAVLRHTYEGPLVVIVNVDALAYPKLQAALTGWHWNLIVVDEAHRIKAAQGKISQFCYQLGQKADHRLALTGTPASDKPLDLFGIYRFLDPGIFGLSFTRFRDEYAITKEGKTKTGQPFIEIVDYKNLEEMNNRVYSIAFRVTDDILDLPEQHDVVMEVELEPETWRAYREMEEKSVVRLAESETVAVNKITEMLRLQQLTSGHLPLTDDETGETSVQLIGTEKRDVLADMLPDIADDEPVVVFCRFVHDLDAVREAAALAGRACLEVSGRRDDLQEWQEATGGQVLAVQIQAGGAGVELQRARYAIYYSVDFSLTNYEQSRKRVHRPGQTRPVTYYHLIVPGSIDEYIYDALSGKKAVTEYVIDRLLEENQRKVESSRLYALARGT